MQILWHNITTWLKTVTAQDSTGVTIYVAFAAGAIFFLLLARRANRRVKPFNERLDEVEQQVAGPEPRPTFFDSIAAAFAIRFSETKKGQAEFRQLLRGAGLYHPQAATHFYAMRFIFLMAPLAAAGAIAMQSERQFLTPILLCGVLAAAVLSIVPRLYVFFLRRRRATNIRHTLPEAMDMLSMCVGGGMPLNAALDHVARQLTHCPELAEELLILKCQAELSSLKLALNDLSARVNLPDVRQLTGLLTRGERFGTKLAGTLIEQSDHMRQTRKRLATAQANKTPVKLVLPMLLCFAPAALILLVGPAMIELKEFIRPTTGTSVISNNNVLGARPISGAVRVSDALSN